MAVKSIIEIDVQDDAFKAFVALFDKYQSALKKMPGAWADAESAASDLALTISKDNDKLRIGANLISKQTDEQKKLQRQIEASNRAWTEFGKTTVNIGRTVAGISLNILKWGAVSGLFTGVGGLLGYTSLASTTATTRRSALELGITPGQLQAANITYERIGGAGNLLSRIAEIREDVSQRYLLEQLGISPQDIEEKDAADLLPQVVSGLRRRYLEIPENLRTTLAPAYGLTQFGMGLSGLRLLGRTGEQEISGLGEQYRQRSTSLGAADATGQAFADFIARLNSASTALQSNLADRLVQLSGPINNVVDAFSNLIRTGINSPEFERGIRSFAEYIQEFSTWLGSERGRNSIREFAENVASVVVGLGRMAAWLASWFPGPREEIYGPPSPSPQDNPALRTPEGRRRGTLGGAGRGEGYYPAEPMSFRGAGVWEEHFSALENRHGLPPGLLNSIYQLESGGGRNLGPSRSGAIGPFQFMPATAQWLGLQNPMDTASSADAAARFMNYLLGRFNGDLEMAAAAYNWGEGNVSRQVARLGPRWREGLPQETRNYISTITSGAGPSTNMINAQSGQAVQITFYNATGGNANYSVNGLSQGFAV
jgi:hypothetical protein